MIEGIIHDWDGCLYNGMEAALKTYSIITGKPVDYVRKIYNPNRVEFAKELQMQVSDNEWRRIFREQTSSTGLFSGAEEYLRRVKNAGYRLALATSSSSIVVTEDLEKFRISDVFDAVVTFDDVRNLKPNPECLELSARNLKLNTRKCIYIGDMNVDAVAAKNIGMKFVGVSWGFHSSEVIKKVNNDQIAGSFDELYRMIIATKKNPT